MTYSVPDSKAVSGIWEAVKNRSISVKAMTKAEYDVLDETQKNADVLYLVQKQNSENFSVIDIVYKTLQTDAVTHEQMNDAINSISSNEIYSIEDGIKIGTWIDGRPLYRKVVTFTTGKTEGQHKVGWAVLPNTGVELVYLEATLYGVNAAKGSIFSNGYYAANDGYRFNLFYYDTDRGLYDNVAGTGMFGASGIAILYYV